MERLQKYMASCGVASRRACEELISAGRVTLNGHKAQLGDKVEPGDKVCLDGKLLGEQEKEHLVYYMLNKPKRCLCTVKDDKNRPTVMRYLADVPERVYPVGRLDWDTEGLLVLTNDGEVALALTHPRHLVRKTYIARVKGRPGPLDLARLREGIRLEDGMTAPAQADLTRDGKVCLTIGEGRNHQVKRMLEEVGYPVLELKRIAVGPLSLGNLPVGQVRPLTPLEIVKIKALLK